MQLIMFLRLIICLFIDIVAMEKSVILKILMHWCVKTKCIRFNSIVNVFVLVEKYFLSLLYISLKIQEKKLYLDDFFNNTMNRKGSIF